MKIAEDIDIKTIGKAALILGEMIAALALVSKITNDFLLDIGARGKDAVIGAGIVEAILITMTAIIGIVGKLCDSTEAKKAVAEGAAVIAGVGLVFGALGLLMPPFIELAIMTGENGDAVITGSEILGLLIGAMTIVIGLIGALCLIPIIPIVLAAGAATMIGIAGVFGAMGELMPPFIKLCILTGKNDKDVEKGHKIIQPMVDSMTDTVESIGLLCAIPFVSSGLEDAVDILKGVA